MSSVANAFSRAAAGARTPRPAPARWARDDRHLTLIGGMIWVLIVLMTVPEGFDYSNLSTAVAPVSGGVISRMLWLTLLGLGLVVMVSRTAFALLLSRSLNPFLLIFIVLGIASVAWSVEPTVTARRLVRGSTIIVAAMAFVLVGWHARRFQNVLRPIITLMLLGSLVFGLGWPDDAVHGADAGLLQGAWHGLTNHKNSLGDIACLGLIFWFHAWMCKEAGIVRALLGAGLAVACLILSRSSTSLVAAVFTLIFVAMLLHTPRALRRYMPFLVALFIFTLLAYSVALLNIVPGMHLLMSPIVAITGKDMTFTGRTEIWAITLEHISLHPWLGTGYGAYWTNGLEGTPAHEFVRRMYFYPGSAHNGYLDILNDLGAVGLVVLFAYLGSFAAQSVRLLQVDRNQAALYLALFLQQAISNLAESRWLNVLSVDFAIMTLATVGLARTLLEHRLRRALGEPLRVVDTARPVAGIPRRFTALPKVHDR